MLPRLLQLSKKYSLLLFGARGTGKSTLLEQQFQLDNTLYINLLDPTEEDRFSRDPNSLRELVEAMPNSMKHVIIDEIQKVPKLLDVVHLLLESRQCKKYFILTGSSARKLKVSGVNLLAGRAFVYHLYPFSYLELGDKFSLEHALRYGMLPGIYNFNSAKEKQRFLHAYTLTYLKEEVWAEQLVKNLDPFRKFLEVAAQANGKIINYANIARDVGAEDKTVKNYFSILEDTLLAVILEPYNHSFRKRLKLSPKFYFFDVGVARSLARLITLEPKESTSYYGELFESFIIMECIKLANYYELDFKFSYLMTGAGVEIDLVVERPGKPLLLIEIKSSEEVPRESLSSLQNLSRDLMPCEAICFAREKRQRKLENLTIYPWQLGIKKYFTEGK